MSDPYGGQDQAPIDPAAQTPMPTPSEPTGGVAPPTGGPGGGWQTPTDTSSFGVPLAAGPAAGVAYADLVPRIIAYVIDALILGFAFGIVWAVVLTTFFITGGFGGAFIALIIGTVGLLIASAAYFILTWTKWRASPGQRILSLETVNADDGATIRQDVAIRRWLYLYGPGAISSAFGLAGTGVIGILSTIVSIAVFAYYIYLLYSASQDPRRQGFHDKQANTVVVKRSAA